MLATTVVVLSSLVLLADADREDKGTDLTTTEAVSIERSSYGGVWYGCGRDNTLPGRDYVYAGGKATYSAWNRPMAVFAPEANGTFFVFGDRYNRPCIAFFDHRLGKFSPPLALGKNPDGNAHRNPTLLIDEDGLLYVFYGYASGNQPLHVLRSVAPYDITNWVKQTDVVPRAASYPQPWQLESGEITVVYRVPKGWCCRTTGDGGRTWSQPTSIVEFSDYEFCSTAYAMTVAENGTFPRRIHLTWSKLGGGSPEEQRTKALWARRYDVYYACSDDGGSTWRRSDGAALSLPITEADAEKVYESGEHGVWLKDIQLDPAGNPCVLFIDADAHTYASTWKFARNLGGAWSMSDIATSDHMYDGGALLLLADDDFRMYGPTKTVQKGCDGGEIVEWRSSDRGHTWHAGTSLTTGSQYSHNHVKAARNQEQGDGRFRLFWSYGDGSAPPATKKVELFYWGEGMPNAQRISISAR
jgi:hypothetical protein